MNEKLRNYIEFLFEDAPKTKEVIELKEEMLQNLIDKYNDLVSEGKSNEAAYNIATASIGDVNDLIEQLKNRPTYQQGFEKEMLASKKRSALLTSIAVMLYIMSVIPVMLLSEIGTGVVGVVIMFALIAIATGLIVYNSMSKPKYLKKDQTVVEEFKEWKANSIEKNALYKSICGAMWSMIVVIYFIISFITMAWHITWVIFLIGSAIQGIIHAIFELRK
ncbi:MAG: permease prefix domain 1-containing protein [Prevotella sp.]|nr:permease prefix domain 1-containing protein [Staphylococcus sp.]MCM1349845.1 permease prefix domain 1-containing protein [Prevotella sp.]